MNFNAASIIAISSGLRGKSMHTTLEDSGLTSALAPECQMSSPSSAQYATLSYIRMEIPT
ncbi:hypothetical protein [Cupriavidus necator]|uniref:hypothetical protein n=1 Tax=Cupriavidus necator TaxID=106590 RepID=UPI0012D2E149|nr:hypothetical protein [Cupriavidus necator]